jgi:hypothetical protein
MHVINNDYFYFVSVHFSLTFSLSHHLLLLILFDADFFIHVNTDIFVHHSISTEPIFPINYLRVSQKDLVTVWFGVQQPWTCVWNMKRDFMV